MVAIKVFFDYGKLPNVLPMSSQLIQPQTMMLPRACFTILLTTRLRKGSPSLFQHHFWPSDPTMLKLFSHENTTFLHYSSIQSLCFFGPFMPTMFMAIQNERLLLILLNANYRPWRFSTLLTVLSNDVIPLEGSFDNLLYIYYILSIPIVTNNDHPFTKNAWAL